MDLTPEPLPEPAQLDLGLRVSTRPAETALTRRALELLRQGPATPQALVEYVCQMPGAPRAVAEHMAAALFDRRPEFARTADGRWYSVARREDRAPNVERRTAGDALSALSFSVVDVETTGGSPWFGHRITEFAAVRVCGGEIVDVYETLVNPERPIPLWVTALTRITPAMVREAPRFGEVAPRIVDALRGSVFVAHNATFDWRFVSMEVQRTTGERLDGHRLCTVKLARGLRLQLRSRSLDHLSYYYGVENRARHRAGGDALATAQILIRMLGEARSRGIERFAELDALTRWRRGRRRRGRRPPAVPRPVDRDTTA